MAERARPASTKASLCLSSLLLFLVLLISRTTAAAAAAAAAADGGERGLLLQIKLQWGNPPALSSWNDTTSLPHCNWTGVQCSADGSVAGLSLNTQGINTTIPSSLCSLRNLSYLDLGYNNITGAFPTSLYNCSNLAYLDLSQNLFVGELPPDIHRLSPRLASLYLSDNNFTGRIPPSIAQLPAIRDLWLDNNLFNGSFPVEIANLSTTLTTLTLAYNPFDPAVIPPEFGRLTHLTYLWMSKASLVGEIPQSFGKFVELEHLDLAMNSLTGRIPAGIWSLEKLKVLYLFKNNLVGEIEINGGIGAPGLEGIDVSINQLNGSIPAEFGSLRNLSVLLMYYNRFSGEIPSSIGLLPKLTDLRLFNNNLTGSLPPELGKHSPLWNIEVDDNRLSGELPEDLCAGGNLSSIVFFDNNLTGRIPASLGECPTLGNIMLQNNLLSGEVPAGIWSAVNLTTVIMSGNALDGALPGRLPANLTRLDIRNNRFSGGLPTSAARLLVFLADNNQFSGEVPANLFSGMSKLQILSLGGNLLSGGIPPAVAELRFLTELNLGWNRLSGSIPPEIGSLPVLTTLDLSSNELSGGIPPELGVPRFNSLNLSGNQLSGEIPIALQSQAYDRSFLANPGLCAPAGAKLEVGTCDEGSDGPDGIPRSVRILLLVLGVVLFSVAAGFGFAVIKDYRRRRDERDLARWKLTSFQPLDLNEAVILRGLREENLIGSGGAGKVYRISLGNRAGETVAVKKIWNGRRMDAKLEKEFQSEVNILSSIRHSNIVKLICCISSVDSKLLVYEYMGNWSLDRWLHRKRSIEGPPAAAGPDAAPLDWPARLRIAVGAAQGLSYMHHDCSPPIVHRDVKSSNILLDSEFRARIADFGLARMLAKPGESDTVSAVAGSFGYMAPECAYSRRVNEKVDVYSFGVVLLELVTGREASGGGEHSSLAEWAWGHFRDGTKKAIDVIDEDIRSEVEYLGEITVVLNLGLRCTDTLPSTRPTMKQVLQVLLRCERAHAADGRPFLEFDVAPLLQTKRGSRHVTPCDDDDEDDRDDTRLACNV